MATSSRVFIKGLPPTFTDAELRKHFSQKGDVSDVKIFPSRRIGYVGYKTPEQVRSAIKYFNKTFIRMSRIGVELARPIDGSPEDRQVKANDGLVSEQYDMLKRKREHDGTPNDDDPKLKEFLKVMKPKSKKTAWERETVEPHHDTEGPLEDEQNDHEYAVIPKMNERTKRESIAEQEVMENGATSAPHPPIHIQVVETLPELGRPSKNSLVESQNAFSDADWARSRTSRLLGLLDEDEEEVPAVKKPQDDYSEVLDDETDDYTQGTLPLSTMSLPAVSIPAPSSNEAEERRLDPGNTDIDVVRTSMRLFVRNLPYDVKEEELEEEFELFGNLEEVHIAMDRASGSTKGFAFVQFTDPDSAEYALKMKDGQPFQGRLMHVLPASAKRDTKLNDFELSKLPLKKQQQIRRRREAATKTFNWNSLYMNADAVVSSVADRLGIPKSEVLDPMSSDAAVKQAHAETHIIQETKAYFKQQGVDLDAFKRSQRGDTAILLKNLPYSYDKNDLKRQLEEYGEVKRFLVPPSGTIAIVEFANSAQCETAYGALAYRRVGSSILFLEKAPKNIFDTASVPKSINSLTAKGVAKNLASDLKESNYSVPDTGGTATLFVRNLNFETTSMKFSETFKSLDGFLSARVKTKIDAKKPGQVLSMGFGFLEFHSAKQARAALEAMDGYTLDGHKLQIRISHKGADAAEERRKADALTRVAGKQTKIVIKNLPFEATKKDVRALFSAYGQLRAVRVPKKMDRAARGFAFADFTTPKEAESAMNALKDTHLLGRRLVLDFAAGEAEDAEAEIEKMQSKVGAQVNKVALQKLISGGRRKFNTANEDNEA